jgi:NADH-quinone oxidoreductase subunit J
MLCSLSLFFGFLAILTAILVIISANPVHSVFFLILSFISVCGTIFLLELEFLPLLLIVVYVGAISILFLFIVIMLDIKFIVKQQNSLASTFVGFFLGILFIVGVSLNLKETLFFNTTFNDIHLNWFFLIDKFGNLNSLGQHIFSDFVIHFLIVGLILLVSIFGAVILTIQFTNFGKFREQILFKQVARSNLESFYIVK